MIDTRELVELIRAALNFCNAAAGDGLEIDGMSPEYFLMRYSDATGFVDWDRIGDHAADTITALSERCRALEEALQFYADLSKYPTPLTGGCGALYFDCGQVARAALASGGRG